MIPSYGHYPNSFHLGFRMAQNRYAIQAWSYLFELETPKQIIEIGTSVGGLACVLGIAAKNLGATFHTFDIANQTDQLGGLADEWFKFLNIDFNVVDCFEPDTMTKINSIVGREGLTVLLCDGGNKPKEFRTFSKCLKPGDIIAAHDFGAKEEWPWQEIRLEDVQDVMQECNISRHLEDVFDKSGWLVCKKMI